MPQPETSPRPSRIETDLSAGTARESASHPGFPWRVPGVAAVVLGAHGFGLWAGTYVRFSCLDDIMHALGGFLVAWGFTTAYPWAVGRGLIGPATRWTRSVLVFGLVAVVAVTWEFFEFGCDRFILTGFQGSTLDTMSDLFLGMTGGAVYLTARLFRDRASGRS